MPDEMTPEELRVYAEDWLSKDISKTYSVADAMRAVLREMDAHAALRERYERTLDRVLQQEISQWLERRNALLGDAPTECTPNKEKWNSCICAKCGSVSPLDQLELRNGGFLCPTCAQYFPSNP